MHESGYRESFLSFLKNKDQFIDWILIILYCLIGYIFLKICYPYPVTISDSITYMRSAEHDFFSAYRPFGFSYFLRMLHNLSPSIHLIFITHLLLYAFSIAGFAFTIKYFYPPTNKTFWYVLLLLLTCSPLALYLSNAILSDLLFAVTIYIILASSVFIFKKQSWFGLAFFLLALFCSLHIRYSAMLFPVLFIVLFLFVKGKIRWISIAAIMCISLIFYQQIKNNIKEITGLNQFSTGFDGWQFANNAMHIEPFINLDPDKIKDTEVAQIHYFMSLNKQKILNITNNGKNVSAAFMWQNDLPLKQILFSFIEASNEAYLDAWVKLGSIQYKKYGQYMMIKYPWKFLKHYYFINAKEVFYPTSTGILASYDTIDVSQYTYFNIPQNADTKTRYNLFAQIITPALPFLYSVLWLITIAVGVLAIIYRQSLAFGTENRILFCFFTLFGLAYYASTVFASPIELRYWLPMNAIHFIFIYLILNPLTKVILDKKSQTNESKI